MKSFDAWEFCIWWAIFYNYYFSSTKHVPSVSQRSSMFSSRSFWVLGFVCVFLRPYSSFKEFFSIMAYHSTIWSYLSILYIPVCICQSQTLNSAFSQPAHPAFSFLLSVSVSLFLFYRQVHFCHILDSTKKWCHTVFVLEISFWFISLNMVISRSTGVAANGIISFFFVAE